MSHDDAHDVLNRRRLLKGSFLLGSTQAFGGLPVIALCEAIVNGFVQRAAAETANASVLPRNYINVLFLGAPARYVFDGWVRVNNSDAAIQPNAMVATRLRGNGSLYNEPMYETYAVNGSAGPVLVPTFFKHSVPTSAGQVPLSTMLKNMLVVRGYGTGLDGHPANSALQMSPLAGTSSISGTVADSSALPFSAVQYPNRGGFTQFSSEKGKGMLIMGAGEANPLAKLMEAFASPGAPKGRALKDNMQTVLDAYSERLKKIADLGTPEGKVVGQNYRNAQEMMKKGMTDLNSYWTPALARYRNLIKAAINTKGLAGSSDLPVVNTGDTPYFRMYANDGTTRFFANDYNVVDGVGGIIVNYLAEGFALSEYMIRNNLGSTMELMMDSVQSIGARLNIDGTNTNQTTAIPMDMHELGAVGMVLYTQALFRGFSAAVMELRGQLSAVATPGGGNLWQETVVQMIGDFSRIGRNNGAGSDHGFNQMVSSAFSGAIEQGPFVVGNVRATGPYQGGGYDGSQGVGAEIPGYIQKGMPTPLMMAATMTELLRVEKNPYSNSATSLITMPNGKCAYSSFGQGKTVT